MKTFANDHVIRDSQNRGHSRPLEEKLEGNAKLWEEILCSPALLCVFHWTTPWDFFIYLFDRDSAQLLSCTRLSSKQIYMSLVPGQEREMAQLLVDNVVVVTWFYLINCLIICNVCCSHQGIQTCKHKTDPSTSVSLFTWVHLPIRRSERRWKWLLHLSLHMSPYIKVQKRIVILYKPGCHLLGMFLDCRFFSRKILSWYKNCLCLCHWSLCVGALFLFPLETRIQQNMGDCLCFSYAFVLEKKKEKTERKFSVSVLKAVLCLA